MAKPTTSAGYDQDYTKDCERVLVTLLRKFGPWKDSVFLIGGLTPRYLVKARPPNAPLHAGTLDIDIVLDLQILTDTQAYQTLEENLKRMGFERAENEKGNKVSWRWKTTIDGGATIIVEFLADKPDLRGGKVQELPTEGGVSALNIPYASMVADLHDTESVTAQLLGEDGMATEKIRYANVVSFTCLKALAFDQRGERKDAYDVLYCLEHAEGTLEEKAEVIKRHLQGKHADVISRSLEILRARFVTDGNSEGHLKDGPVSVARFETGDGANPETRERQILRQRQVSDLVERLVTLARS